MHHWCRQTVGPCIRKPNIPSATIVVDAAAHSTIINEPSSDIINGLAIRVSWQHPGAQRTRLNQTVWHLKMKNLMPDANVLSKLTLLGPPVQENWKRTAQSDYFEANYL